MTGYDALSEVNALLLDPSREDIMTTLYRELTGDDRDFEQQIADGKRMVVSTIMQAEVRRLARLVPQIDEYAARVDKVYTPVWSCMGGDPLTKYTEEREKKKKEKVKS